ncbi:MAG TPA: helix-turn-helix transcriptional regulator [Verrucomicrobiae bacterium]|nr:helix-turn-helix transcriptional regulator [Verrucomicrobiae bacterium]
MKPKQLFEPHLVLNEISLLPGSELTLQAQGWCVLYVKSGVGYWLHPRSTYELLPGSVLVSAERARGQLRASQLTTLSLMFFRIEPERLAGLVTWGEQQFFERLAAQERFVTRLFSEVSPPALKFRALCEKDQAQALPARIAMLQLFVELFTDEWRTQGSVQPAVLDAKSRLVKLLSVTRPAELLNLSFADLVREMRCTPRHLSRLFHEVVGMSFREKQAQVRLARAQELLATTETKIVEVALESGYPSACLFNLMFKKRFGMTPAKWRDYSRRARTQHPLTLLKA